MSCRPFRCVALGAALFLATAASTLAAQAAPPAGSVTADLLADIEDVEKKLMALAKAIPADKFGWRPGEGVRSVGEVLQHVAADNYFLASPMGVAPPAATGIDPTKYPTVVAYETRKIGHHDVIRDLETSFAHLKTTMKGVQADAMGKQVKMFGQDFTMQRVMILTATHLHEHLGQLIAYARSNGVKPPWS